ncbi:hypothetical protein AAY473_035032 [Plecturocebus cupreus]
MVHCAVTQSKISLTLHLCLLGIKYFGRLRLVDYLRSEAQAQPDQHGENPVSTKNTKISQAWWHVPVIPAAQEAEYFGRLRLVDYLRSEAQAQPDQHGENPVSTKNTKISQAWWRVPVIPATQEAEKNIDLFLIYFSVSKADVHISHLKNQQRYLKTRDPSGQTQRRSHKEHIGGRRHKRLVVERPRRHREEQASRKAPNTHPGRQAVEPAG